MALPSTTITRTELSMTFTEFDLAVNRKKFIGPRVFVPVPVGIQAADVGKVPIEALLQTPPDTRAPGGGYRRSDFEFSKFDYATEERGREEPLDDRKLAIYRDIIDAEAIHAQRAQDIVLRNYELDCAAALYDTTVWTGAALTTAITEEWDDHTNGVPIDDVEAARQKVKAGCGINPNALVCNRKQMWNATQCAQVVDRLKYWGGDDPKRINVNMLAALFDLDYIIVADGIQNSANEGQDVTVADIWSDEYMMVCRVATTRDPQEACIGRTFFWTGDGPGVPGTDEEIALLTEEYREEGVRGSVIRARNDRVIKVMYAQCGHLLSNAITI